jgi:hypothetical protein
MADDWTIFLDMDGVCTNFMKGALTLFDRMDLYGKVNTYLPASPELAVTHDEFWARIDGAGPEFWRNLEELPWYTVMRERLSELGKVVFLTSPSRAAHAASGKVAWMFDRYGHEFRDFVLAPDKHYCSSHPRGLLIDDLDRNVDPWPHSVLFPQPWNSLGHSPDPNTIVEDIIQMVKSSQRHAA